MNEGKSELGSDAELIRRLQAGQMEAFDALFDRHRRRVLAYVLAMTKDAGLAEDIVQECFVELARNIGRIAPARGVGGWLFRVARNRTIDELRRRRFEVVGVGVREMEEAQGALDYGATPADDLAVRESAGRVREALESLPERERELLVLRFYGGLKYREIAHAMRRPIGTVLWQARRSLEKLRTAMEDESLTSRRGGGTS